MDPKRLLDQILSSGTSLLQDGKAAAERALQLPTSGEKRQDKLETLAQGAMAGGLLALLVGTRRGRRWGGKLATYGGLAGLGALAWRTYQDWQRQQPSALPTAQPAAEPPVLATPDVVAPSPVEAIPVSTVADAPVQLQAPDTQASEPLDGRSRRLWQTLILACRADGHIDGTEQTRLVEHIRSMQLPQEAEQLLMQQLDAPLDTASLAREVTSPAEGAEIYLAARLVIDIDDERERAFLSQLARDLQLDSQFVARLEQVASS